MFLVIEELVIGSYLSFDACDLEFMIILLYGEDDFRSSRKLAEIRNRFLEKNNPAGAGFVFDFSEKKIVAEELLVRISSGGLFSDKKLVIFKNIFQDKKVSQDKGFLDFLKKTEKEKATDQTFVFWEKEKFRKDQKLAKFLLEKSRKEEFLPLHGLKLEKWIEDEVEAIGQKKASISREAIGKLAVYVGDDLFLLSKEIEKMVNFKDGGKIEEVDVDVLVRTKIDTNIFKAIDSLARRDKKTAMKLLHDHLSSGDDPLYLLSMYFYQFRNLLKIKNLSEINLSEREIIEKLKLHPFVVKKGLEQGRGFTLARLKELYGKLCDVDYSVKSGKADIELALDKFLAQV